MYVSKLLNIITIMINFVFTYFLTRQSNIQLQRNPKHEETAKTNQDNSNTSIENNRNKEVELASLKVKVVSKKEKRTRAY
jgi:hypothetical protein